MRQLLLLSIWVATSCSPPQTELVDLRQHIAPGPLLVGAAHVAGQYGQVPGQHFFTTGVVRMRELGMQAIKLYLTPEVPLKYPGLWPSARRIVDYAKSKVFDEALRGPESMVFLTTYTFSSGTGDRWRQRTDAEYLDAEENEMSELTTYLCERFAGSGKTFVLQNWEGDWALLGGFDPWEPVPKERADRMRQWLLARQRGVATARSMACQKGVDVIHAVEVNRVLDEGAVRVVSDVLPGLPIDAVSYSAWESLEDGTTERLPWALERLKRAVLPGTSIYLGEFGFPETEMASAKVGELVESVVNVARINELRAAIYWQVFDNECKESSCRGLWLSKPDGSPSLAAHALQRQASLSPQSHQEQQLP